MDERGFRKLVTQVLDSLPKEFLEKLNNVSVVGEDFPTDYQQRKTKIPASALLFGLYEGIPQTKRGIYYSNIPDKITIFKNAILQFSSTEEEIRAQIRSTVIHEIDHRFGLSEEDLKK